MLKVMFSLYLLNVKASFYHKNKYSSKTVWKYHLFNEALAWKHQDDKFQVNVNESTDKASLFFYYKKNKIK